MYRWLPARGGPRAARSTLWRKSARHHVEGLLAGSKSSVDQQIAEIVRAAPPLSDDQVDEIVAIIRADALMRPSGGAA
jgi:hypothetical protein